MLEELVRKKIELALIKSLIYERKKSCAWGALFKIDQIWSNLWADSILSLFLCFCNIVDKVFFQGRRKDKSDLNVKAKEESKQHFILSSVILTLNVPHIIKVHIHYCFMNKLSMIQFTSFVKTFKGSAYMRVGSYASIYGIENSIVNSVIFCVNLPLLFAPPPPHTKKN